MTGSRMRKRSVRTCVVAGLAIAVATGASTGQAADP